MHDWNAAEGVIVAGHGVASGRKLDPRFPQGTLAMQAEHFAERGFDLSRFWPGTLNVAIAPASFTVIKPALTFRSVKWHPTEPTEDFSFFECRLSLVKRPKESKVVNAWIYYPHPDTKPEHEQPVDVLEVLAPRIAEIAIGDRVVLSVPGKQMRIDLPSDGSHSSEPSGSESQ